MNLLLQPAGMDGAARFGAALLPNPAVLWISERRVKVEDR